MQKTPVEAGASADGKSEIDAGVTVVEPSHPNTTDPDLAQASTQRRKTPKDRVVAVLDPTWRVVADDLQWHLQHRKGGSWRTRSWCRTKQGLAGVIKEHVGADALAAIADFPLFHEEALLLEIETVKAFDRDDGEDGK